MEVQVAMKPQRLFLSQQAQRVMAVIHGIDGHMRARTSEWWSVEPQDIFVARTDEWYGPRDWSPRKKKRGDLILAEVYQDEQVSVFIYGPNGQAIWSLDPFFTDAMLVIIPATTPKAVAVP